MDAVTLISAVFRTIYFARKEGSAQTCSLRIDLVMGSLADDTSQIDNENESVFCNAVPNGIVIG